MKNLEKTKKIVCIDGSTKNEKGNHENKRVVNKSSFSFTDSGFFSELEYRLLNKKYGANKIKRKQMNQIEKRKTISFKNDKNEVRNLKDEVAINEYLINQDSSPEIIKKTTLQQLEYIQKLAVRYLRPPTPPSPGEILINQLPDVSTPPAPPLVIRQQPPRPVTPEPLIIREAPPQPPAQIGRKIITISGKRIPPPPRKVVIERLTPLPPKPQDVIVERWLPYAEVKRRVIFQKPTEADPIVIKPKNVIVQWSAPQVNVKREYKYLGVIRANPQEYVERYGNELKKSDELPQFVLDVQKPEGIVLAAEKKYNRVYELEGNIEALNLINLENEGLGEYRNYLQQYGIGTRKNSLPRSQSAAYNPKNNFTSQRKSPEENLSLDSGKANLSQSNHLSFAKSDSDPKYSKNFSFGNLKKKIPFSKKCFIKSLNNLGESENNSTKSPESCLNSDDISVISDSRRIGKIKKDFIDLVQIDHDSIKESFKYSNKITSNFDPIPIYKVFNYQMKSVLNESNSPLKNIIIKDLNFYENPIQYLNVLFFIELKNVFFDIDNKNTGFVNTNQIDSILNSLNDRMALNLNNTILSCLYKFLNFEPNTWLNLFEFESYFFLLAPFYIDNFLTYITN